MTPFILSLIADSGYWGIALLMCLENVLPPIPSELIMGLGGIAVAHGKMHFWPLLIAGTIGSTAGNYFWYALGRFVGYRRLEPIVQRWSRWLTLEWHDIEKIQAFFKRHGGWVVFVFRFMPTFRTIVSLPAGMLHMSTLRFLAWTFAGAAIWNSVLIGAGYFLGTRFRELETWVGPAAVAIVVAIVLGYVWRVITWKARHARGCALR
jgi:membrane protein DedA with SNARE-associated domain